MHDTDLIDPPPTDVELASDDSPPDDLSGSTEADALLALLAILDAVRDDPDGRIVVWCADATPRSALDERRAARPEPISRPADSNDARRSDADRGARPSPCTAHDRPTRYQRRRSRR